jgi:putative YphP/YqiW family bacilliredoxin
MAYPEEFTDPMRRELVQIGVQELRTPQEVDAVLLDQRGTTLVFVNSVCGCAAGTARPGLALALQHDSVPDRVTTVFAGVDMAAVARVRSFFAECTPTSPQVALFKDGELVELIQRHDIEGNSAETVAERLRIGFDKHCRSPSGGTQ